MTNDFEEDINNTENRAAWMSPGWFIGFDISNIWYLKEFYTIEQMVAGKSWSYYYHSTKYPNHQYHQLY